jgi:hypothetical protein
MAHRADHAHLLREAPEASSVFKTKSQETVVNRRLHW